MIADRWLVAFTRRTYGNRYADLLADELTRPTAMADHLRRAVTSQMRRPEADRPRKVST